MMSSKLTFNSPTKQPKESRELTENNLTVFQKNLRSSVSPGDQNSQFRYSREKRNGSYTKIFEKKITHNSPSSKMSRMGSRDGSTSIGRPVRINSTDFSDLKKFNIGIFDPISFKKASSPEIKRKNRGWDASPQKTVRKTMNLTKYATQTKKFSIKNKSGRKTNRQKNKPKSKR